MRILIFHGYLLRGTGSNVYNASLAQALARLGHEVHLLCQDREAASLEWVDRFGRWSNGRLELEPAGGASGPGTVTAYVPGHRWAAARLRGRPYEGFRVKTFARAHRRRARRPTWTRTWPPSATSSTRWAGWTPRLPTTSSWAR